MSAGGAFGGARGLAPKPPEKGVFPLDHFGECKKLKEAYTQCLADHASGADACTPVAKAYLECRMERNLMARQDIAELGLDDEEEEEESKGKDEGKGGSKVGKAAAVKRGGGGGSLSERHQPRTKEGFVAGLRPKPKK